MPRRVFADPFYAGIGEGRGWVERRSFTLAGGTSTFTDLCPGQYFSRLETVIIRLAANATAATRTVVIEYLDASGNLFMHAPAPATTVASVTRTFAWAVDFSGVLSTDTTLNLWAASLPNVVLQPGESWRVRINNGVAGDTVDRTNYSIARFPTDRDASTPPRRTRSRPRRQVA